MKTTLYSPDKQESVSLETEDWKELLLKHLKSDSYYYIYVDDEVVNIDKIVDSMVSPLLFYTLHEMGILLNESMETDVISTELRYAIQEQADLDSRKMLKLTYDQVVFVQKYKKEVEAWLPIVIKKYVRPNSKKIKDLLSGNI